MPVQMAVIREASSSINLKGKSLVRDNERASIDLRNQIAAYTHGYGLVKVKSSTKRGISPTAIETNNYSQSRCPGKLPT